MYSVDLRPSRIFFFLMIRRPPRSTLFPYTRSSDLEQAERSAQQPGRVVAHLQLQLVQHASVLGCGCGACGAAGRSEEHTSELQSQSNLVCRLLLEKKK